jgi:hypothetical protein
MLCTLALRVKSQISVCLYCPEIGFKQQKLQTAAQIVSNAAATAQVVNEIKM